MTQLNLVNIDGTNSPVALTFGTLSIFDSQFTGNSGTVITAAPNVSQQPSQDRYFRTTPAWRYSRRAL